MDCEELVAEAKRSLRTAAGARKPVEPLMSLATRPNRLTPARCPASNERFIIRAHLTDSEPGQEVLATMPAEQRREYDYYISLLHTSNTTLGVLLKALTSEIGTMFRSHDEQDRQSSPRSTAM